MFTRRPFASWSIVYSALGVAVTFPLVLHLGSTIAGDLADPLFITSVLWWNAHVVPLTERWWNGFAFFPVTGMLAFSDYLLGESLIATPLQWLGCSPATAYNLLLIATFPLCAIAAHALGFVLTRRHDAAALCGLAYGFNPYRIAHISHVQLLAAFGMPAALAALHLMADAGRRRWTVAFAVALIVQALCTGYYIAFFAVLLFLWVLWFVRWRDGWPLLLSMAAAAAGLAIVVSPLAIGYARIHREYGMAHNIGEVLAFSADVTSLVTATSRSALWFWTSTLNGGEGQIFPGLVMATLALGGAFAALRGRPVARDGLDRVSLGLACIAAAYFVVAVCARYFGPWRIEIGPVNIGADVFFKPLSVALAAATLAIATSSRARDAWRRRSLFAFYAIATVVLFICSFGPKPAFLGRQVLYEPPYAWLMQVPVFSTEIRAPARFAMLAILTLSVAGSLVFDRLRASAQGPLGISTRRVVFAALMLCVLADGWPREFPVPRLPDLLPAHRADGFEAVLELPLGDSDQSAMYRATVHQHPIVNGASGFLPSNYEALIGAVRERNGAVLDAVAATGHVLVAVDNRADSDHFWSATLRARADATSLGNEGAWSFFTIEPAPRQTLCESGLLPIARATSNQGDVDLKAVTDGDPVTSWRRPTQRAGDALVLDLGTAGITVRAEVVGRAGRLRVSPRVECCDVRRRALVDDRVPGRHRRRGRSRSARAAHQRVAGIRPVARRCSRGPHGSIRPPSPRDIAAGGAVAGFRHNDTRERLVRLMRLKVRSIAAPTLMLFVGLFLSACTTPGVDKALGTGAGADAANPVVVTTSPSTVVIENHAGRPLLNVRVAVDATGSTLPFVKIVSTVATAETVTLQLADFRTDDAVTFDPGAATPKQVTVKARDTMSKTYEASASW